MSEWRTYLLGVDMLLPFLVASVLLRPLHTRCVLLHLIKGSNIKQRGISVGGLVFTSRDCSRCIVRMVVRYC